MSQEDVKIVQEVIRRFEASDFDAGSLWHEDCVMSGPAGWPEVGPFEGRDAVLAQFRRLAADWGEQRIADVEVVADRENWIIVTFRWVARGGRSGAPIDTRFAGAYRIEERRIREAHFRWTPEEAFAAAGLSE
jgi:ketosteroid isomerase-like protein